MERALAVVEPDGVAKDLVREAGELAAGVGAELLLVHVTTDEEFEETQEAMESIPDENVSYGLGQARDGARTFAADVGREVLADVDVDWEALGMVGDREEQILATAAEHGCDHVFIAGRKRSPAGKAVFGDLAQDVVLEFDGPVTVVTA